MAKLTPEDRQEIVESLVANDIITKEGKPAIEAMTDEALLNFADATLNTEEDEEEPEGDDTDDSSESDSDEPENHEHTENSGGGMCEKCGAKYGKRSGKKGDKEMTGNRRNQNTQNQNTAQSFDEFMENAPPQFQELIANAANALNDHKAELIKTLVDNSTIPEKGKPNMVKELAECTINELKRMVALIPKKPVAPTGNQNTRDRIQPGNRIPGVTARFNFGGAGQPVGNSGGKTSAGTPLMVPTTNWSEAAKALK